MSNSLESLVKTISEKKALIGSKKEVMELDNPHVVRTRLGHINRAQEDLKDLYREYRSELQSRAAFILVIGSKAGEFAAEAETGFGCFSLDADTFYKDILEQVPAQLYTNRASTPGLFDHFAARFESRALDIEIIGYQPLFFDTKYNKMLTGKEDALALIKEAFNDRVGSEVVGLDAIDRVASRAVNENFSGSTVPIVLFSQDESLIGDLSKNLTKLTGNVFVVTAGTKVNKNLKDKSVFSMKTVTTENVEKSLMKIKENLN